MRRKVIMLYAFLLVVICVSQLPEVANVAKDYSYFTLSKEYLGIANPVTGIYLYYRIFDTLFEALLLLTSVIGIIYFSRSEGDLNEEEK